MAVLRPKAIRKPLAWMLLLLGFLYLGSFEFIREKGRKPYIIHDYMYSTSIKKAELTKIQETGVLASARWVKNKTITPDNRMEAGKELFTLLCLPCHSAGGPLNDILPLARRFSPAGMRSFLATMGTANPYMPPFAGNEEEQGVLADYLTRHLVQGVVDSPVHISKETITPAPFNRETADYMILASSDTGMVLSSEPEQSGIDFSFAPPTLRAQLILRGEAPALLTEDIEVSYRINTDTGVLVGHMTAVDTAFEAMLPAIPPADKDFRPYLLAEIEAVHTGKVIASTRLKIGTSTEIGCRNCHGGPWRQQGRTGLSRPTAAAILAIHDKRSKTQLSQEFARGTIVVCSSCHADSSRGGRGPTRPAESLCGHAWFSCHLSL